VCDVFVRDDDTLPAMPSSGVLQDRLEYYRNLGTAAQRGRAGRMLMSVAAAMATSPDPTTVQPTPADVAFARDARKMGGALLLLGANYFGPDMGLLM
jgi:hypothetical protein